MEIRDLNDWVGSGGTGGYYTGFPVGTYPFGTIRFNTGLKNTIEVEQSLGAGAGVVLHYADGFRLTDISFSLGGAVTLAGIDLASIEISADSLKIEIGGTVSVYTRVTLDVLIEDLEDLEDLEEFSVDSADAQALKI